MLPPVSTPSGSLAKRRMRQYVSRNINMVRYCHCTLHMFSGDVFPVHAMVVIQLNSSYCHVAGAIETSVQFTHDSLQGKVGR